MAGQGWRGARLVHESAESRCSRSAEPLCRRREPALTVGGRGGRDASPDRRRPPQEPGAVPPGERKRFGTPRGRWAEPERGWGGGFGEGGERGSSEGLLPPLAETQRPTSFYHFYFLSLLLAFKMSAPPPCRRTPGPSPFRGDLEAPASPHSPPLLRLSLLPPRRLPLPRFLAPEGSGGVSRARALPRLASPSLPADHGADADLPRVGSQSPGRQSTPLCLGFLTYKMGVRRFAAVQAAPAMQDRTKSTEGKAGVLTSTLGRRRVTVSVGSAPSATGLYVTVGQKPQPYLRLERCEHQ